MPKYGSTLRELTERANAADERVLVLEWLLAELRRLISEKELRVGDKVVGVGAITHIMADLKDLHSRYAEQARILWGSETIPMFSQEDFDLDPKGESSDGKD